MIDINRQDKAVIDMLIESNRHNKIISDHFEWFNEGMFVDLEEYVLDYLGVPNEGDMVSQNGESYHLCRDYYYDLLSEIITIEDALQGFHGIRGSISDLVLLENVLSIDG